VSFTGVFGLSSLVERPRVISVFVVNWQGIVRSGLLSNMAASNDHSFVFSLVIWRRPWRSIEVWKSGFNLIMEEGHQKVL